MRFSTNGSFMTKPLQILIANGIITKHIETVTLNTKYDELNSFLKKCLIDWYQSAWEEGCHIKMACTVVLFPCGMSAQEVQNKQQSNSHACFDRRQTMETARDENNF